MSGDELKSWRENNFKVNPEPGSILPMDIQLCTRLQNWWVFCEKDGPCFFIWKCKNTLVDYYKQHRMHAHFNEALFWSLEDNSIRKCQIFLPIKPRLIFPLNKNLHIP